MIHQSLRFLPLQRVPSLCGRWALLVVLCCLLASACSQAPEEGVVATVNGEPITLKELEATYDLVNLGWGGQPAITVASLRSQYGMVLSQMIIQTLVEQELAKQGASITQDERNKAEAVVRMDYPPGEFERMLLEEYIDLQVWRSLLERNLAVDKFRRNVLRATVQVDPEEVMAYYQANQDDFVQPATVRIIHVTGPGRTLVRDAALAYVDNPQVTAVQARFEKVFLQEITMQEDRLPKIWVEDLRTLKRLTPSVVRANQAGFESLLLLERVPARQLDAGLGAPLAQDMLLEGRLEEAFHAWLEGAMQDADIEVSAHLLAQVQIDQDDTADPVNATAGNATTPDMPLGEEGLEFVDNGTMSPEALTPEVLGGSETNASSEGAEEGPIH